MLLTAGIYILAIVFTLSELLLPFLIVIFLLIILSLSLNLFSYKHLIIWSVIVFIGVLNTSLRLKDVDELSSIAPLNAKVYGKIVTIPQGKAEGKIKFFFDVNSVETDFLTKSFNDEKILVSVNTVKSQNKNFNELKLHNYYILSGRISQPFKAGNPSQFDYGNYLRNHNAYSVFYADDFSVVEKELSLKSKFMQRVNNYRENILEKHSKYLKSPNLEILGGIVFGDDAVAAPKDVKESFIHSGLLHILAASGMNVAFIFTFFFMLMSVFKINYKLSTFLGMLTVIVYSMMTGLGASVIRATIMLLFVLAGKLIDRDAHSISLLSLVALLMLIYNPLFINDVGFQLSFIVTFGLLITGPIVIKSKNKIVAFIISTITIPIIAQLWVIPIQIFYFNNISIYSVFANIMSIPILMVLSFGGFISSLLAGITPIADVVCRSFDIVLNPLITLLINISDFWGKLPLSTLQTTHPSIFQILLYYGILLSVISMFYKDFCNKYLRVIKISLSVLSFILLITLIPIKNSALEITAFDVGNADAFMIKAPDNQYIFIDTGKVGFNGGKSQAEIIILKYLKDIGVKKVNSVVISHFDNDHCGGAVDLIKNLNVDSVYVTDLNHESNLAKTIYKTAKFNNTQLVKADNSQVIYDKNGLKLTNYIPTMRKSDNENSIITLLEYEGFSMLFTGDSTSVALEEVLNYLPKNIDVLKVPHHGADGGLNRNIIKYLAPKYSIVSVGENKFGHPSLLTLGLLEGSEVLRTDIHNAIKIKIKGKDLEVLTFDNNRKFWRNYY